jgi:lysophospholipase L1-like esterase
VEQRDRNNYPRVLNDLLGERFEVRNFGVSGRTLLRKGDFPIWKEKAFQEATKLDAHVVVIKLGTNDTKPHNWAHRGELEADLGAMVEHFRAGASKPVVVLCLPVPAFPGNWGIDDERIREGVIPAIRKVAKEKGAVVVDLYEPLKAHPELVPDKVHPNAAGARLMAQTIAREVFGVASAAAGAAVGPGKPAYKAPPEPAPIKAEAPAGYKVVYEQLFAGEAAMSDLQFSDPRAWRLGKDAQAGGYLEQFQQSKYATKVRSPFNIALIASHQFGSFVMDVKVQQTGKEYGHRDLCFFYGFEGRSRYYYTHVATKADPNAHQCFIVDNQPRRPISDSGTAGFNWAQATDWHRVRVVRDIETGRTAVYVNDMDRPVLTAKDKTLGWGHVGVGSFDDTGRFAELRIMATESRRVEGERSLFKD